MEDNKILRINNLIVDFPVKVNFFGRVVSRIRAVNDVSFDVNQGEIIGIVGESGCGKSTLARTLVGLNRITSGSFTFANKYEMTKNSKTKKWQDIRRDIQMIFQDPIACLDPRMTIGNIIEEPLKIFGKDLSQYEKKVRIINMMKKVGLTENQYYCYPHEFSGGQCQRVGIARALICAPKLLICDEPISALDVSIQAQILNLLYSLQSEMNLTVLFISHNLNVVGRISDRIIVMYLGNIVEIASKKEIIETPKHPYTASLFKSIPQINPNIDFLKQDFLQGELPSPINPPSGCPFRTRCKYAQKLCSLEKPKLKNYSGNEQSYVACHYPL